MFNKLLFRNSPETTGYQLFCKAGENTNPQLRLATQLKMMHTDFGDFPSTLSSTQQFLSLISDSYLAKMLIIQNIGKETSRVLEKKERREFSVRRREHNNQYNFLSIFISCSFYGIISFLQHLVHTSVPFVCMTNRGRGECMHAHVCRLLCKPHEKNMTFI